MKKPSREEEYRRADAGHVPVVKQQSHERKAPMDPRNPVPCMIRSMSAPFAVGSD